MPMLSLFRSFESRLTQPGRLKGKDRRPENWKGYRVLLKPVATLISSTVQA